nr:MAG TPA: hypothetical protein [Caudoviricetes sp.]
MMKHTKLVGLQSPVEQMANVAANAAQAARETTTRTSGVISVDNSDGTKTILGSGNGVALNVGDTTPPSKPVGLAAASQNGSIVAYWSGSLEEEKPADFYCVSLYAEKDGTPVKMGELTAAGSCIISGLTVGEIYKVYATAEDNTCNYDGSPAHNVSEKSAPVMVEVLGGGNGGSADIDRLKALAEQAAKEAKEAKATATTAKEAVDDMANTFSHDSEGAHVGSKTGMHTTIDAQGMKLKQGNEEVASFHKDGVTLASGSLHIHAGLIKDIADNSTAFSSDCFDFESETLEYHYAPRFFFRAKSHNQANNGFVGTDYDLGRDKLGIASPNGVASINTDDLVKLLQFTPWVTLQDDGACRVRYCLRGGMMYLDCYLAAGYATRTTTAQLPKNLLPAIEGYYPMGTQTGNNTAKIWVGSASGGDGHIYLYNWSSGYATGIIPILPKSME